MMTQSIDAHDSPYFNVLVVSIFQQKFMVEKVYVSNTQLTNTTIYHYFSFQMTAPHSHSRTTTCHQSAAVIISDSRPGVQLQWCAAPRGAFPQGEACLPHQQPP